ncbi:MAG: rRNA pseudouridine synthase, partial [Armatimonadetes bacterium]|nr:rRNA pseudouridine synthase [Armatimonadota bacterium]
LGAVVKPIGRLDYNSEGLLLFTNDGELIERITHPRYGVWKTYRVDVRGTIAERKLERVRKGVILDGRRTAPAKLELVHYDQRRDLSIVDLSIHEGRKHQVKNMMQAVGVLVISLKRVKVGPIGLGRLRPGECKMLSKVQVTRLKKAAGLEQSQSA